MARLLNLRLDRAMMACDMAADPRLLAFYRKWRLRVDYEKCKLHLPLEHKMQFAGPTGGILWATYTYKTLREGPMRAWPPEREERENTHVFDFCLDGMPPALQFDTLLGDDDRAEDLLEDNMMAFASEFLRAAFPDDATIHIRMDDSTNVAAKRITPEGAVQYCRLEQNPDDVLRLVYAKSDPLEPTWDGEVDEAGAFHPFQPARQ